MTSLVLTLMIISGIIFIISIMLMTPKGGIGFGIGGMSTSNEYGSKKSVESTLKKSAIVSIVVFTLCALVYPYVNKAGLSTWAENKMSAQTQTSKEIKVVPSNVKITTENNKTTVIKTDNTETTKTSETK